MAIADLLQHFNINATMDVPDGEPDVGLLPKKKWGELFDCYGEGVHLYRIELDGETAEEIKIGGEESVAA